MHGIDVAVGLGGEGPNACVQPQRVLEWLQDTAAHASAAAGYPAPRYREMGAGWFIREIVLCVDHPIRYGDRLRAETWVSDFRRFRSRRQYRLRSEAAVVARAEVEWLFLERDEQGRFRPRRVEQEMLDAFPIDPVRVIEPGEVPELPEDLQVAGEGEDLRRVRWSEIDRHGHVNHGVYLGWLEDQLRAAGGTGDELCSVRLQYLLDARAGEEVRVRARREAGLCWCTVHRGAEPLLRAVMRRAPAGPADFR